MKYKFVSLILCLLPATIFAENHMVLFGGAGDPKCVAGSSNPSETPPQCNGTIFDYSIIKLGENLKDLPIKYDSAFNGGHQNTEKIIKELLPKSSSRTFTQTNYNAIIKEFEDKILSGKITDKDQLVIIINTHGFEKNEKEKSHSISIGKDTIKSFDTALDSPSISLDTLSELIKLTNERGIKLGIVDLSCSSGNILNLKSENTSNTCFISATGPKHYAFASEKNFGAHFLENLKPNKTLEEIFLEARVKSDTPEFPMISTNEGMALSAKFYNELDPYLQYSYDEKNQGKLRNYMEKSLNSEFQCRKENQFNNLLSQIEQLQKSVDINFSQLKKAIINYKEMQDMWINGIKSGEKFKSLLLNNEKFSTLGGYTNFEELSWQSILVANTESQIKFYEKRKKDPSYSSPFDQAYYDGRINLMNQIKVKQDMILKNYPELKSFQEYSKNIQAMINKTYALASAVGFEEKKFFNSLYKKDNNSKDPCSNIKF